MHKAAAIFLILLTGFCGLLTAQEEPEFDIDWDDYSSDLYVRGDQTFIISLGTVFPIMFINNGKLLENKIDPPIGGTGLLAYNYYFNKRFFLGGELGGMFLPTLGNNTVFLIPFGARTGLQFYAWRFEFPITLSVGMCWHNYLNLGYYGFYLKGSGAAFFRATSEWSFGLSTSWGWYPEWTREPSKDVHGHFVDLLLTARYHF